MSWLPPPEGADGPVRLCVLVVDDDPVSRLMLSVLLRQAGHKVLQADGGRSALAQLDEEAAIDLVLLDLSMPDIDGFGVLKVFRARPSTRWQPVIVVSANESEALILEALEAGADDYMTKPIDRGFLMAKIRNFSRGISIQRSNLDLLESLREKQQALLDRQAYELELGRRIQSTLLLGNLPTRSTPKASMPCCRATRSSPVPTGSPRRAAPMAPCSAMHGCRMRHCVPAPSGAAHPRSWSRSVSPSWTSSKARHRTTTSPCWLP